MKTIDFADLNFEIISRQIEFDNMLDNMDKGKLSYEDFKKISDKILIEIKLLKYLKKNYIFEVK